MKFIIPFLVAFIGSKLIFSFFNFSYLVFDDPFNLLHFSIDIGVFIILWGITDKGLSNYLNRKQKEADEALKR